MLTRIKLYEVFTRAFLNGLPVSETRSATLDDIPDEFLDGVAGKGFDWIWWMGMWQTGKEGRKVSRTRPGWVAEYRKALPDLTEDDITGSPFAITGYTVNNDFGGLPALKRLRERMRIRGLRLMLDFMPNHTAIGHPWVLEHPDFFIHGRPEDLEHQPENYTEISTPQGPLILAHGRDPNFPGWPDTLQLDYSNRSLHRAMTREIIKIAGLCDGIRCDMAMLLMPDIFMRTWRKYMLDFWPEAIVRVKDKYPGFLFMAEVYWDREWELQQQGFDYCYDKRLYDRLLEGNASTIRDHLRADISFQERLARFLENHDESRAATAFNMERHLAAAVVAYFLPGLRFFHHGQLTGARVKIPVHLRRGPVETVEPRIAAHYESILSVLKEDIFSSGDWQMLDCRSAWDENLSYRNFLVYRWSRQDEPMSLVCVNFHDSQGQCYVRLPFPELAGKKWMLRDLLNDNQYERAGSDLLLDGLYLDLPAWGFHIFRFRKL